MVSEFAGVISPSASLCLWPHLLSLAPIQRSLLSLRLGMDFVFIGIARKVTPEAVDRKEKAKRSVNWLALL